MEATSGSPSAPGPTDELVICTLDRPLEVARCLASVAAQERPPSLVRVVDASAGDETRAVVADFASGPLGTRLVHQPAARGLTRQRNAAVSAGTSDLVHFVDDDTVLDPGYLAAIVAVFEEDRAGAVLGVGGLVTNVHHPPAPWAKRLFLLDGDRPGRVLRSGRNQSAVDLRVPTDVDWLSGCAMSFRRSAFQGARFDESLEGYGLGEDVEFSYRLRQRGRLVVTPAARIEHLQSERNRLTSAGYTYDELVNRARRVRARTGCLRMRWYWWSVIGQLGGFAVISLARPDGVERARLRSGLAAVAVVLRAGGRAP